MSKPTRFSQYQDGIMKLVGNNGGKFSSEKEVREYFTVKNITALFGDSVWQEDLDDMVWAILWNHEDSEVVLDLDNWKIDFDF